MPPVTIPVLNNLSAFQTVIQGQNVSEVKRVLIDTVTNIRRERREHGYFTPAYRTITPDSEGELLKALKSSNSMDDIRQALCNYTQQLSDVRHLIPNSNTSAFIRGIEPLVDQMSLQEDETLLQSRSDVPTNLPPASVEEAPNIEKQYHSLWADLSRKELFTDTDLDLLADYKQYMSMEHIVKVLNRAHTATDTGKLDQLKQVFIEKKNRYLEEDPLLLSCDEEVISYIYSLDC